MADAPAAGDPDSPGDDLRLDGLHHITMITGDARMAVDFYADVLGLRLVKKTVNFDDPSAYHLYFGDEDGAPGSILTWFDFSGVGRGRVGGGMIHRIQLGVADDDSLDFWGARLRVKGYASTRRDESLSFEDFEGLNLELVLADPRNRPLRAAHPPGAGRVRDPRGRGRPGVYQPGLGRRAPVERHARLREPRARRVRPSTAASGSSAGPTTRRRSCGAARGREPSTTSPGRRPPPTSSPGGSGSARPAST